MTAKTAFITGITGQDGSYLAELLLRRDWGWAPNYVEGMTLALQAGAKEDFVLATGRLHRVQDFVEQAFRCAGLHWEDFVEIDPALIPAAEPVAPCGNADKALRLLNWKPSLEFEEIVERLVHHELTRPN